MHLQDWMGDHRYLLWLMAVPILLAGEVLRPRRVFISLVPAALVGAVVALIGPGTWWLQVFLAAAVAAVSLVALRPRLLAAAPPPPLSAPVSPPSPSSPSPPPPSPTAGR